ALWPLLGIAASIVSVLRSSGLGDYPQDAGPALSALAHGHAGRAIELQPLMGSLSLLLRAPFAALAGAAGAGSEAVYEAGAVPCVLAAAALGVWFAAELRRAGRPVAAQLLAVLLPVFNPATSGALGAGHPEEILCGALCVAAVVLASRNRPLAGALALGLALATKQWALVAAAPFLVALPRARARAAVVAAGVATLLTLPLALGDPGRFLRVGHMASTTPSSDPLNLWWPFATARHIHVSAIVTAYDLPAWLNRLTHPLIVLAPIPLAFLLRRRAALLVLALAFLLRCALDPVDIGYYHVPLVLALLAGETFDRRRTIPVVTIATAAAIWLVCSRIA